MTHQHLNRFPDQPMLSLTSTQVQYDLAESVGPDLQLSDIVRLGDGADLDSLALSYGTAPGSPQLRAAIADRHQVGKDDVVVTVGGMHAIFLTGLILCSSDDVVLMAQPVFPMTTGAIAFNGARIKTFNSCFEHGYQLDVEALVGELTSNTRLVCLASPQNPSGVALTQASIVALLRAMSDICPQAFLLIDETYREASYNGSSITPSLIHLDDRIISCASLSKCHGAPGLRIGWVISQNPELITQYVRAKFQTVIACSGLDETLALTLVQNTDLLIANRSKHLAAGRQCVASWVAMNQEYVDWVEPDAGALCCIALKPSKFKDHHVAAFYAALEARSVRVAPGDWFEERARVFRLGFGFLSIPDLQKALEVLTDVLNSQGA